MPSASDVEDFISEDMRRVICKGVGPKGEEGGVEGVGYVFEHLDFGRHAFDLGFVLVFEFGEDCVAVLASGVLISPCWGWFLVIVVFECSVLVSPFLWLPCKRKPLHSPPPQPKKKPSQKRKGRNKPRVRRRRSKPPINPPSSTRPRPRIPISIPPSSSYCSGTHTPISAPISAAAAVVALGRRPGSSIGGIVLEKGGAGIALVQGGGAESAKGGCYRGVEGEGEGGGIEKGGGRRLRREG